MRRVLDTGSRQRESNVRPDESLKTEGNRLSMFQTHQHLYHSSLVPSTQQQEKQSTYSLLINPLRLPPHPIHKPPMQNLKMHRRPPKSRKSQIPRPRKNLANPPMQSLVIGLIFVALVTRHFAQRAENVEERHCFMNRLGYAIGLNK